MRTCQAMHELAAAIPLWPHSLEYFDALRDLAHQNVRFQRVDRSEVCSFLAAIVGLGAR